MPDAEEIAGRRYAPVYRTSGRADIHRFLIAAVGAAGARVLYASLDTRAPVFLGVEIGEGKLHADAVRAMLSQAAGVLPVTSIAVAEVALASFDELLGGGALVVSIGAAVSLETVLSISQAYAQGAKPPLTRTCSE